MWSGLPSYYVGDEFIRIIPFKDHVNVESSKGFTRENFPGYFFTPKGMFQLFVGQDVPIDNLKAAFSDTLL